MKFGLTTPQWLIVSNLAIDPLKKLNCRLFVFGSRARGDSRPFSDLDLLIESPTELDLNLIAKITSEFEESNLPIKVDLVQLQNLAESYRAQVMLERIEV